jgi:hypothetical protein
MDWTKVITDPMGVIGFVLSLVFGVLGVRKGMPSWWPAAAMILAAVSIAGGLFLAFKKVEGDTARLEAERVEAAKSAVAPTPALSDTVKSAGPCSPVYSGVTVGGNMEQNFDCSVQSDPKASGVDKE